VTCAASEVAARAAGLDARRGTARAHDEVGRKDDTAGPIGCLLGDALEEKLRGDPPERPGRLSGVACGDVDDTVILPTPASSRAGGPEPDLSLTGRSARFKIASRSSTVDRHPSPVDEKVLD
jgi:hypothetical protein